MHQRPLSLHRSILTHALYHVKHPSHSKAHRQRFQHSFRLSLLLLNLNILIHYHFSSCSKVIPFLELITKVFTLFFLVHFMLILHTFLRFYAKFQLWQVCYFLQFLNTFGNVQVLFNVIDESASFRQYLFHVVWYFSITKAKFSLSFRFQDKPVFLWLFRFDLRKVELNSALSAGVAVVLVVVDVLATGLELDGAQAGVRVQDSFGRFGG